jgi:hypothetical protein
MDKIFCFPKTLFIKAASNDRKNQQHLRAVVRLPQSREVFLKLTHTPNPLPCWEGGEDAKSGLIQH